MKLKNDLNLSQQAYAQWQELGEAKWWKWSICGKLSKGSVSKWSEQDLGICIKAWKHV
jgi:hypothetical protein